MKILSLILILSAFCLPINAQTKTIEPLVWKGTTIDLTSPDDIISKFGKPEKEEIDNLDIPYNNASLFTKKTQMKEWKVLKYKEIEHVTKVRFGFNKENKLVYIKFNTPLKDKNKMVNVQAFLKSFENISFKPKESSLNQYILLGKQQSGYVLAEVSRGIAGLLERKSIFDTKTIEDVSIDNLDGIVLTVQFISKSLENNDNTDILK